MDLTALTLVDYGIIGVVVLSLIIGIVRGLIREALSLITWALALWLGIQFSSSVAGLLTGIIKTPTLRLIISFVCIFALVLIVGTVISVIVSRFAHSTGLSGTDRVLGMAFGLGRGVLVVGLLVLMCSLTSLPQQAWWKSSTLIPPFQPLAKWMQSFLQNDHVMTTQRKAMHQWLAQAQLTSINRSDSE